MQKVSICTWNILLYIIWFTRWLFDNIRKRNTYISFNQRDISKFNFSWNKRL